MSTIEGICTEFEGPKRTLFPGIKVTSTCPTCGKVLVRDLAKQPLSNGDPNIFFYCWDNTDQSCETEWTVRCRLEIKLIPLED